MANPPRRRPGRAFAALLSLVALGCGDDGPTEDDSLSVAELAAQLSAIRSEQTLADETQKAISDLATAIATVMASKGELGGSPPVPAPPGERTALGSPSLTAYLAGSDLGGARAARVPRTPPLVLGVTCIWDIENSFWKGAADKYGPVPLDGTRFELYETQPGGPTLPLEELGTFVDVRPLEQSSNTKGPVDVRVEAKEGDTDLLTLLLDGESDPETDLLDLLMSGTAGDKAAGDALDYVFTIDDSGTGNTMQVQDILIVSALSVSGSISVELGAQKRDAPRQSVFFSLTLANASTIESGTVDVDGQQVATVSGSRLSPTFQVTSSRFDGLQDLRSIYQSIIVLDGRINELFFFSHCVGADHPEPCLLMSQALGS